MTTSRVPDWLSRLHALVRASVHKTIVSDELRHVERHVYATTRHFKDWFVRLAEVCVYVGDPCASTLVLTNFSRCVLDASTAPWFENLRDAYGNDWFRDLWSQCGKWGSTFDLTPDLVTRFDVDVLRTILDTYEWNASKETFDTVQTLLKACLKVRGVPVVPDKWIRALETWGREAPSLQLLEMVQFLVRYSHADGLDEVKKLVLCVLDAELEALDNPEWSLDVVASGCSCDACTKVILFLQSKSLVKLDCQMSVRQRNHVMARWQKAFEKLPLEWTVKKCCRPYRWVMVKKWWLSHEWPRRQRYRDYVKSRQALHETL